MSTFNQTPVPSTELQAWEARLGLGVGGWPAAAWCCHGLHSNTKARLPPRSSSRCLRQVSQLQAIQGAAMRSNRLLDRVCLAAALGHLHWVVALGGRLRIKAGGKLAPQPVVCSEWWAAGQLAFGEGGKGKKRGKQPGPRASGPQGGGTLKQGGVAGQDQERGVRADLSFKSSRHSHRPCQRPGKGSPGCLCAGAGPMPAGLRSRCQPRCGPCMCAGGASQH